MGQEHLDRTPDRPPTAAAGEGGASPAAGAPPPGKLGASPGSLSIDETSGPERRRITQDAAVTAAEHDAYWRRSFGDRPYTRDGRGYEHYRPAYRFGWEARAEHGDREFEDVEGDLEERWDPAASCLDWDEARPAVRDAYTRDDTTDTSTPGNPLA